MDETEPRSDRVLVVDDEESVHFIYRRVLTPASSASPNGAEPGRFAIVTATSGRESLELARQARDDGAPFSVAFLDVRMPGMDGVETAARLWEIEPDLQVALVSGHNDYAWADLREALGHTDSLLILKKPFEPIEALQVAHCLAEKRRLALTGRRELHLAEERLASQAAERERMERELRLAQKLEAVGQLAAGVAHEINTPIQFVGDSLQFLEEAFADLERLRAAHAALRDRATGVSGLEEAVRAVADAEVEADLAYLVEEVPRAFARTFEGVERVATIVRAMKAFAHPSRPDKEHADLNAAVRNTLTVAKNEYKYVAEVETDLGAIPPVLCHLADLNQVLLNLVVNAAHAVGDVVGSSGRKGLIRVATWQDGDHVAMEVSDTGCGIPKAVRDRVFDPFFTTKPVGKGTGQGLAIARSIVVDKHGGTLSFDSNPGQGTTFTVRIPIEAKP